MRPRWSARKQTNLVAIAKRDANEEQCVGVADVLQDAQLILERCIAKRLVRGGKAAMKHGQAWSHPQSRSSRCR